VEVWRPDLFSIRIAVRRPTKVKSHQHDYLPSSILIGALGEVDATAPQVQKELLSAVG
jgi:hypothetical protein